MLDGSSSASYSLSQTLSVLAIYSSSGYWSSYEEFIRINKACALSILNCEVERCLLTITEANHV